MAGKLQDRSAVITGGNSGIGLATAERFVADDKVGVYGLACWSAFDSAAPAPLDISQVLRAARRAAGTEHHHFRAIETPLNSKRSATTRNLIAP